MPVSVGLAAVAMMAAPMVVIPAQAGIHASAGATAMLRSRASAMLAASSLQAGSRW
jgi:hypothetical protein